MIWKRNKKAVGHTFRCGLHFFGKGNFLRKRVKKRLSLNDGSIQRKCINKGFSKAGKSTTSSE